METGIQKHTNWFDINGDETLALDWPLDENSYVWEIGGFEGRWAQQIWDRYHCNITIFEPQLWAVSKMHKRFDGIDKISVLPFGLWIESGDFTLGNFETDGCSLLSTEPPFYNAHFQHFQKQFMYHFEQIHLGLMNIEGAEYALLPAFIESGVIQRFNFFWCQFHPKDENDLRHEKIFTDMEKTHSLLWDYFPIAVAWCPK